MDEAIINARDAFNRGEIPVGCVFVFNNEVIARGSNKTNETKNATRHAELICIDIVLEYAKQNTLDPVKIFENISVVVTVEPCIMCAAALHNLNAREVIYGCKNDRFGGTTVMNVFELLKSKVKVSGGIRADEAMELLKEFYKGENPAAPVPSTKRQKVRNEENK